MTDLNKNAVGAVASHRPGSTNFGKNGDRLCRKARSRTAAGDFAMTARLDAAAVARALGSAERTGDGSWRAHRPGSTDSLARTAIVYAARLVPERRQGILL